MLRKGERLKLAESIIGCYTFKDRTLLWEALQAAGSGVTKAGSRVIDRHDGNKRLAVVGDMVPGAVLSAQWYPLGGTRSKSDHVPDPYQLH